MIPLRTVSKRASRVSSVFVRKHAKSWGKERNHARSDVATVPGVWKSRCSCFCDYKSCCVLPYVWYVRALLPKGRYGICCQTMERSSSRHNEAPKDKIMRAINPLYSDSQKCLLHHPAEGIARD